MLTLEESQTSYALHLKLSPNICYSHTNNKLITLPKFEPTESIKNANQAEVAQVVSQRISAMDDESNSMGAGLFGQDSNGAQNAAAAMRAS